METGPRTIIISIDAKSAVREKTDTKTRTMINMNGGRITDHNSRRQKHGEKWSVPLSVKLTLITVDKHDGTTKHGHIVDKRQT